MQFLGPPFTFGINQIRSEERRVGKGVDLGGRRIIKKKKNKRRSEVETCDHTSDFPFCLLTLVTH